MSHSFQIIRIDGKLLQAFNNLTIYLKLGQHHGGVVLLGRCLRLLADYFQECEQIKLENAQLKAELNKLKGTSSPSLGGNNGSSNLVN